MPLPMPNGHVWTDFLAPAPGANVSATLFGQPTHKDLHHLREVAPLVLSVYLDATSGNVIPGDLVALLGGTGNDWKVIKTTTLGQTGTLGVMQDAATAGDGAVHQAQFSGVVDVNVQMGVHTGNWLRCSATDGAAEVCLSTDTGACMRALTESATTSGGQVTVLLYSALATGLGGGGGGGAGGSAGVGGSLAQLTVPAIASMTQVNATGCTFTQDTHAVYLVQPPVGGHSVAMAVQALGVTAPYYARCAFMAASPPTFWYGGLVLRESSSGKLILWGVRGDGTLAGHYYSSPVVFGSFITGGGTPPPAAMKSGMWWFEIYNDGTNNRYRMSPDGRHWAEVIPSELNNAHLVADQIGFGVNGAAALDGPQIVVTHLDCGTTEPLPEIA